MAASGPLYSPPRSRGHCGRVARAACKASLRFSLLLGATDVYATPTSPARVLAGRWRLTRLPWGAAASAVALVFIGWAAIHRSGYLTGATAAGELGAMPAAFLHRQLAWSLIALTTALISASISWEGMRRSLVPACGAVLALLLLVYAMPPINGAHRWVRLGPIGLQPSEPAKLVLVAALAIWLGRRPPDRLYDLLPPTLLALVPALLVLRQPDLGSAVVLCVLLCWMLVACNTPWRLLGVLMLICLAATPLVWAGMSREQRSRITAYLHQTLPEERPDAEAYHLHQAKQVLALGGKWGSLLASAPLADPARRHLPEAHTDFILVVIGERFGWLGTGAVLGLIMLLVSSLLRAAARCEDPEVRLFVTGVAGLIACQALINAAMVVGLLPIVGLGLPFVSYGGSSLVTHAVAVGLVFAGMRSD